MAIMRQQARFIEQLYSTGMVDDQEVTALFMRMSDHSNRNTGCHKVAGTCSSASTNCSVHPADKCLRCASSVQHPLSSGSCSLSHGSRASKCERPSLPSPINSAGWQQVSLNPKSLTLVCAQKEELMEPVEARERALVRLGAVWRPPLLLDVRPFPSCQSQAPELRCMPSY